eukprot:9463222-Pyramimonas_sp.AAC.1
MKHAQEYFGLSGTGTSSSAASSGVEIKVEPKSELDQLQVKIDALKADPTPTLRKFQDFETELSQIKAKADGEKGNKYATMLSDDVAKVAKKVVSIVSILKKMVSEPPRDGHGLPKLINTIETVTKEIDDAKTWASTFGFNSAKKRRRGETSS